MKADITKGGLLEIKPETGIEFFALRKWVEKWLVEPGKNKTLEAVSKNGIIIDFGRETGAA